MRVIPLLLFTAVVSMASAQMQYKPNVRLLTGLVHKIASNAEEIMNGEMKEYENITRSLCNQVKFKPNLKIQCEDFIDKIPSVISLTMNEYKPKHIVKMLYSSAMRFPSKNGNKSALCQGCTFIVNIIKFDVKVLNMSSKKVKEAIEFLCDTLAPLQVQKKVCHDIMDAIDTVIQKVLHGISPGNICYDLNFCTNSTMNTFKPKIKIFHGRNRKLKNQSVDTFLRKYRKKIQKYFDKHFKRRRRLNHRLNLRLHNRRRYRMKCPITEPTPTLSSTVNTKEKKSYGNEGNDEKKKVDEGYFTDEDEDNKRRKDEDSSVNKNDFLSVEDILDEKDKYDVTSGLTGPARDTPKTSKRQKRTTHIPVEPILPEPVWPEPKWPKPKWPVVGDRDDDRIDEDWNEDGYDITEDFDEDTSKKRQKRTTHIPVEPILPEPVWPEPKWPGVGDRDDDLIDEDWNEDEYDIYEDSGEDTSDTFGNVFGGFKSILKQSKPFKKLLGRKFNSKLKMLKETMGTKFGILKGDIDSKFGNLLKTVKKFPELTFPDIVKNMEKKFANTREKIDRFMKLTKNGVGCTICKTIVKFIEWEIKTVNASIEFIEKEVELLCKFYPIKEAQDACNTIIKDVDTIIQLIEQDVQPGDICIKIGLCSSTAISTSVVKPTKSCSSLCSFMKTVYQKDMLETANLWNRAKMDLMKFCKENDIVNKCNKHLLIFEKAERKLSALMTLPSNQTDECQCFPRQPIFHNEKDNLCQLCKHFEKGLINELLEVNRTMETLVGMMKEMCQYLPDVSQQCVAMVAQIQNAFVALEKALVSQDICVVIDLCKETNTFFDTELMKKLTGGINPFLLRGAPMAKRVKQGIMDPIFVKSLFYVDRCSFCKTCLENLNKTLTSPQFVAMKDNERLPAVKEGLGIYCEMYSKGEDDKYACKKFTDNINKVVKVISESHNVEETCKNFDMC